MTSNDIEKAQIILTTKDGQHLMAVSDDRILIAFITEMCKFVKLKNDIFEECNLKESIE